MKNIFFNLFVFIVTIALLFSCTNKKSDILAYQLKTEVGKEEAKNVEIFYSDSAVIRMKLKAFHMINVLDANQPKRIFDNGIEVYFFDKNGSASSQLFSQYGTYSEKDRLITLTDSVVLHNYRNEKLETEELFCKEQEGIIFSKKFVKISTPNEIIIGYGFKSNLEFTDWEIDSVSGIFGSQKILN